MRAHAVGEPAFAVRVDAHVDLSVYATGPLKIGCAVFFPGQHGLSGGFEEHIAPLLAARGVRAFTAVYASTPDGPRLTLGQAEVFAIGVIEQIEKRCGRKYVVVGRSLGAMVAAYAVGNRHPAALLLEGASPSLATALRSMLTPRLGASLVDLVPMERLLRTNYNLLDALGAEQRFPVTVIQGTQDLKTPISELTKPGAIQPWIEVVPVKGAAHHDAWQVFMPAYVDRILNALVSAGR